MANKRKITIDDILIELKEDKAIWGTCSDKEKREIAGSIPLYSQVRLEGVSDLMFAYINQLVHDTLEKLNAVLLEDNFSDVDIATIEKITSELADNLSYQICLTKGHLASLLNYHPELGETTIFHLLNPKAKLDSPTANFLLQVELMAWFSLCADHIARAFLDAHQTINA